MELSDYLKTLSGDERQRYLDKIKLIKNMDPYMLKTKDFDSYPDTFKINTQSLVDYLLFRASASTQEEFRAHKSLQAYTQVVSKWVKEVKFKQIDEYFLFVGKVLHSQALNKAPAKSWVILNGDGRVECAHCDCVAGLGEVCSHVAAILFSLQNIGSESVTDRLAYWIGTSKKEIHLSVDEIDFTSSKRLWSEKRPVTEPSLATHEIKDDVNVTDFLMKYKEAGCVSVLHQILKPFASKYEENIDVATLKIYKREYEATPLATLQSIGRNLNIVLTEEKCREIEISTRNQSKSTMWFLYRRGRVTASNFKAVCHTKVTKPSISLIQRICYPKKTYFKQGIYGCEHEKDALKVYETQHRQEHPSICLTSVGLILTPEYPEFGATPDSFMNCEDCGNGCVEVKCPFCIKDTSITELLQISTSCLKYEGNKLTLDKNHAYFYQIQMQLFLSKKPFCDFVVWTQKDFFVERIFPDVAFWEEKRKIASEFFYGVILPELLGRYYSNKQQEARLELSSEGPSGSNIEEYVQKGQHKICICNENKNLETVVCSNKTCPTKQFHLKCVQLSKPPKQWWCKDCRK